MVIKLNNARRTRNGGIELVTRAYEEIRRLDQHDRVAVLEKVFLVGVSVMSAHREDGCSGHVDDGHAGCAHGVPAIDHHGWDDAGR